MAEVYHFLECLIKRVGSASGDSTETSIDAYCEGVSVSQSRELQDRVDTSGVVQQRIPTSQSAQMTISKLYSARPFLFDGNAIKLYMANSLGTETWQFSGAYWTNEDYAGTPDENGITYDLQITGQSFGTV